MNDCNTNQLGVTKQNPEHACMMLGVLTADDCEQDMGDMGDKQRCQLLQHNASVA